MADTVRWGYVPPGKDSDGEEEGIPGKPIVEADDHVAFICALFGTAQAGLQERRPPVNLFTTNYDILIEDALALACIPYWDGFTGGAVAFRGRSILDKLAWLRRDPRIRFLMEDWDGTQFTLPAIIAQFVGAIGGNPEARSASPVATAAFGSLSRRPDQGLAPAAKGFSRRRCPPGAGSERCWS